MPRVPDGTQAILNGLTELPSFRQESLIDLLETNLQRGIISGRQADLELWKCHRQYRAGQ